MQAGAEPMTEHIMNGIRVVLVANRKGGSGKSTLCRALASAAEARCETVTVFDTDGSQSCLKWQAEGRARGTWSTRVEVIHSLDAGRIGAAIAQMYDQPDQEHLILIDTFGGASEAHDELATLAHLVLTPMLLSRADFEEAKATAEWYVALRSRVSNPEALAPFGVLFNRVPLRVSETEREIVAQVYGALPAFENFLSNRASYIRMDQEGLLGPIRDSLANRALAQHVQSTLDEAEAVLAELDTAIRRDAEAA